MSFGASNECFGVMWRFCHAVFVAVCLCGLSVQDADDVDCCL